MRTDVIDFFQNLPESEPEQFNKAFQLYGRSPGKNLGAERKYNAGGYTKQNLANLLYDLSKLHSISDLEKLQTEKEQDPVEEIKISSPENAGIAEKFKALIIGMDWGTGNYVVFGLKLAAEYPTLQTINSSDLLAEFAEKSLEALQVYVQHFFETNDYNKIHLPFAEIVESLKEDLVKIEFPTGISQELQQLSKIEKEKDPARSDNNQEEPLKFRDQYPFLNDLDCPNELKILVSDKLTHYNAYKEAHAFIQAFTAGETQASEEQKTKAAAAAAFHFEQSENIAKELDYYAAEKQVLGEHPIFAQLALQREVDEMTQDDLLKFKTQTASFISKKNKKIRESQSEDVKAEAQRDIDERNAKLALVNKRLGVDGK